MKNLKYLVLASLVVIFSCSSDNDTSSTTPTTIQATGGVNWSSFIASQKNITGLVTFNGQAASTYTIATIKGDKVTFQFNIGNKNNIKVRRELVFLYVDIDSPKVADEQFLGSLTYEPDPNHKNIDGSSIGFTIGENAPQNYDGKFNMYFRVLEDGVDVGGEPFVVDPKITIRTSR